MEKLTLETLPEFDDGSVAVAVNEALTKCYHDLMDRPGLKTKREVTMKITLTPDSIGESSELEDVIVRVEIGYKCPGKGTAKRTKCSPKNAGLMFNSDTNNTDMDADQRSLGFDE